MRRTAASVLAEAADRRATVVLSGHVQPDADALGSTLALAEGLRRRGARVLVTFPDPFTLPASLGWLPGAEGLVPSSAVPSSPDVFVSLDAASPGRLGELAVLLDAAGTSVVVDHHASNPGFGDVRLIDGGAPATVTLVAGLLDELGVPLDAQLATLLYAGLAADTGSFRFGNTRPETHELAARLLATGIDHSDISRRLFDTAPSAGWACCRWSPGAPFSRPMSAPGWCGPGPVPQRPPSTTCPPNSSRRWSTWCGPPRRPTWPASSRVRTTDPGRCRSAHGGHRPRPRGHGSRRRGTRPRRRLQLLPRSRQDHRGVAGRAVRLIP
ncbi:DHH family phosphoesterase [Blastococcus brunescens]|uniref:DHH family phosphoesterase n=1 Tax=Blastococcus brunescens TaxID=1564165 RepID=A0ABZ1AVL1_9ACTN|nr:DHH family phosphoesterase [Blastococcus sp. BMG 8361]WRL62504.1 DHH family phosphoesterase [Blastococcus sp. BMG 8361]